MKTRTKRIISFFLILTLVFGFMAPAVLADTYQTGIYKVTADNGINMRSGAGTSYTKITALPCNAQFTVTEVSGTWGKTTYNSYTGWVCLDYAVFVSGEQAGSGTETEIETGSSYNTGTYITTSTVNLRSGAGTGYSKYTTIPSGAQVEVSQVSGSWGKTAYGGYTGWFSLEYAQYGTTTSNDSYAAGIYVTGVSAALRAQPSSSASSYITIPVNKELTVTEISGSWGKTTYGGYTGWLYLIYTGTITDNASLISGDQRNDLISVARNELGNTVGSKYTFGRGSVAWCAYFVSWCSRQAGIPVSVIKTAAYARASEFNVSYYSPSIYIPQPGDLVFFDWADTSGEWNHVGIVETVNSDGSITTLEGNSSDKVARNTYKYDGTSEHTSYSSISYFGVPNYSTDTQKITDFSVITESGTAKISWAATNADYYDVYVVTSGGDWNSVTAKTRTDGTTASFNNLADGNYEVFVMARPGSNASSAQSSKISFSINGPKPVYALAVTSGSGSGEYTEGTSVAITADTVEGMAFNGWATSGGGSFTDPSAASTTFTMPAEAVTVTASYAEAASILISGIAVSGGTSVENGKTLQMSAVITPSNAYNKAVVWSVTDGTGKATISESGLLTAAAAGTVTVTATAADGSGIAGKATVTITTPVEVITYVTTASVNLRAGAGTSYTKYTTIPNGTTVKVTEVSGSWGKTTYRGYTGWLCLDYAKKVTGGSGTDTPATVSYTYKTTSKVNLRSGAGTGYSIYTTVPSGTTVKVTAISGNWGKTTYGSYTGWLCLDYASKVTETAAGTVNYQTTGNVNMRTGAGTGYSRINTIPKGTTVTVTEVLSGWGKTTYGGKTGWFSLTYAKKLG